MLLMCVWETVELMITNIESTFFNLLIWILVLTKSEDSVYKDV